MVAEKHIRHYNRLNGSRISTNKLAAFHQALKRDIDAKRIDSHVPFGVELLDIEKRMAQVLADAKGYTYLQVQVKPIRLDKYKVKEKAKVKARAPKKEKPKVLKAKPVKKVTVKMVASAKPKPVAKSKPVKKVVKLKPLRKLNGIVSADQISAMDIKEVPIDGIYKQVFNKLYTDSQLMVWGMPGSGKTVGNLLLADYLQDRMGLKVLYLANEEMNRSTLVDKLRKFKISNKIAFAKNLREVQKAGKSIDHYDVVFFDSIQSMGIDLNAYKQLVDEHPGKIFVLIVQSTKDGDFRGGKDWEHEVDIAGEYINRQLVMRKNRLDPDFEKKSEEMYMQYAVQERKKKHMITRKVKEELSVKEQAQAA